MDTMPTTATSPITARRMNAPPFDVCCTASCCLVASANARRSRTSLSLRPLPDAPVVHEADLAPDHLVAILLVLHRGALQIEVLRIDRFLVKQLVQLRAQVLHPVVPLRAGAMVAERLDVDHAAHVRGAGAVVLAAHDAPLVVDDERAPAEGVDRRGLLREQ